MFVGVLVYLSAYFIIASEERLDASKLQDEVYNKVHSLLTILEQDVNGYISGVFTLEALIQTEPDVNNKTFSRVSLFLTKNFPAIENIQLAPDGVIQYVFPETNSNRSTLGAKLFYHPLESQRLLIKNAIDKD